MSNEQVTIDIGYRPPELKKVLIVDDEMALQTLIQDTLEGQYRLMSAYNGRKGIEMAEKVMPDLILMDVMMPDIGGYEAVKILRANEKTKHIPIIVMTAKNFDESMVGDIKSEVNVACFLQKPFRPKGLRDAIIAALEKFKRAP